MERGYPQNIIHNIISRKDTDPSPTKQNKEKDLALRNTTAPSSSKSEINPNDELVPYTEITIAKPNFQGAAHNITQKRAFTQRHTRKSEIITQARKRNHVFRSRVGLSTNIHVNQSSLGLFC